MCRAERYKETERGLWRAQENWRITIVDESSSIYNDESIGKLNFGNDCCVCKDTQNY